MAMSKWLVDITVMLVAAAIPCALGEAWLLPPAGMVAAGAKP
jgi:hypothetical protein